jgi:transpeptidase family protein/penicillin-binding protein/MecA-like transpeptidase family protein
LPENHNQRLRRALPVLALAAVAFAVGAIVGAGRGPSPAAKLAQQFVSAWTHGDYRAMYADIDAASQRRSTASAFAAVYEEALRTATATHLRLAGRPRQRGARETVPVRVATRLFGTLALDFELDVEESDGAPRVRWSRSLAFPGLRAGELLSRSTTLPPRATLLARDGSVLAEGSANASAGETTRSSPLGEDARALLGSVGPIPSSRSAALAAEGVPDGALVGLSGLERALDERLRGRPGGALLAGHRLLAYAAARAAPALHTTVSTAVQRAAVAALGGRLGGVVAMTPAGEILAVAGIGLEGLQPPGSTFKIVTLTGVLQEHVATPTTVFPYASFATLDGVRLSNANGENCGGSLELAFAVSCNSVFAPLGVKLGAPHLVAMAERFGFNHAPGLAGAAESTLPAASSIEGELALGSTAIGQGQVLATPLQMATVAATIADGGRRPQPSFLPSHSSPAGARVTSAAVARTVRRLMIGVVRIGTGTAAAIPGVTVAGKTGTAELKTPCHRSEASTQEGGEKGQEASREAGREACHETEGEAANTDAWFAAFAPALHPRIVVCVMLVKDGAGGTTAAPAAREVIEAGLQALR